MRAKHYASFAVLLILINICSAVYHFKSTNADVTISGTTYKGTTVYADLDQNAQQIIYPFSSNTITETEMYNTHSRYQICTANTCNAYYVPYNIPKYNLSGLSVTTTGKMLGSITTNYYKYNDGAFLVELWVVPGSSPAKVIQVRQSGSGFDRTIFFNDYATINFSTYVSLSAPSETTYPGCATKIQCGSAMDVVLVIDTSGSITPADYVREQNYVKSVVQSFDVGVNGVHIGFITFSTAANIRLNLTYNENLLLSTIDNTIQDKGETNIAGGIYAAIDVFNWGARDNVPKVMIFLTDGAANLPGTPVNAANEMLKAANLAKASPNNILIYAIGVGPNADPNQLALIATAQDYISTVADFATLSSTLASILETVCVGGDSNACSTTCTNTQFCGCGLCVCSNDVNVCGSRGTYNSNTCGCDCTGSWSNDGTHSDCSICNIQCSHGTKLSDCTCDCGNKWEGTYCTDCPVTCNDHQVNSTNCQGCVCKNFWGGTDCQVCDPAGTSCSNGGTITNSATCSGCTCPAGTHYTSSSNCKNCDSSYCLNGGSATGDCKGCDCANSWVDATFCATCGLTCQNGGSHDANCKNCVCTGFYDPSTNCATCKPNWCVHGTANADCSACTCAAGWKGARCDQCDLQCQHGGWVVDQTACTTCTCPDYYYGTTCQSCDVPCVHGTDLADCSGCDCAGTNFEGNLCNVCKSDLCNGQGSPKSQTTCNSCNCNLHATGTFCETCNTGDCLYGSVMNSDCSDCICKKYWDGDNCDNCNTGNNYGIIDGPCIQNTLSDTCVPLVAGSTQVGTICYNLNIAARLKITATMYNSKTISKVQYSIYDSVVPTSFTTFATTKNPSNVNPYSTTATTSGPVFTIPKTYYIVIAITFSGSGVPAYGVDPNNINIKYNTLPVGTCKDCLCNYPCVHGTVDPSTCNSCSCQDGWSGSDCSVCDTNNRNYCNKHGNLFYNSATGTCNSCTCDANFKGTKCDQCDFTCQNGGWTSYPTCNTCNCPAPWTGADCSTCNPNVLCNNRGTELAGSQCTKCECNAPWQGDTCSECSLTCNGRGTGNAGCTSCVCDAPWSGADCSVCSDALLCQHAGTAVDPLTCNSCDCTYPYDGNNCETCVYDCNGNGNHNSNCDGCYCNAAFTVSSDCLICDSTNNCTFCNKHGEISNPDSACDTCTCYDYWGGEFCDECTLDCTIGQFNEDCTACVCPGLYTPESNCVECPLVCQNGGAHNSGCTKCNCVNGWSGSDCTVCSSVLSPCQHASTLDTDTCSCDCPDQWVGRLCDKCTTDPLVCNIENNGGFLLEQKFGQTVCECSCVGYWSGSECDQCLLNPLYGDAKCNNIQEPTLGDCTCHCPQYYVDDESCETCIIKPSDCVHPKDPAYVNLDPLACDCGECLGNYSGRNCSFCSITSCPTGYAFNETDCTCYAVCGNGIISSPDEQCEVSLMQPEDQTCCTTCLFNTAGCDDTNSCTFDDICSAGYCDGLDSITFNVNQDRMPLSPGPIPPNAWSRWGVTVSSILTTPLLYDTTSNARANLKFPNANPRGGSTNFGLVIAQSQTTEGGSICINMANPMEFSLVSLLGVHIQGTKVQFYCADPSRSIYTVDAKLWSQETAGAVEYIPVPCGDFGLDKVCFSNLLDAAIGPLYTCNTDKLPKGAIGDYVWSDFNRDNVQDSIEIGIPTATVTLYDGNLNVITSTITDADGKYLFTNLYPGNYYVQFQVPDGWKFSTPVTLPNPDIFSTGRTTVFYLTEGQTDLTRDAGLYFSGKIGDYVWYDVNQDGIQSGSGESGVSGVTVNLYYSTDKSKVIKTTTTDASGFYLFEDLLILKTATTFYTYSVEVIPPAKAIVTAPFKGGSTILDSNFDQVSHFSNDITLFPNLSERVDLSIDCGIYYCCGSIGDFVWYDVDKNGIQGGVSETGVPNLDVTLYWNGSPKDSVKTDSNGNYLFTGLPLYGTYKVYFSLPSTGYIFTVQDVGNDATDSDASASGVTDNIFLSKAVPDVLTVDAGIISGCTKDTDCAASTDLCASAKCDNNICSYFTTKACTDIPVDPCTFYKCNSETGSCDLLPTGKTCNDGNICTDNDRCTINGCVGTPNNNQCDDNLVCTVGDICTAGVCKGQSAKTCTASTNACRYTICDEKLGCIENNYPDSTPCEDGTFCTVGDVCISGECRSGSPVVCALSDSCHTIQCSALTGICQVKINTGSTCDDKNLCTSNDVCATDGTCSGTPVTCSQAGLDQCHVSTCNPSSGTCEEKFIQRPCDDSNRCTENDACDPTSQKCKGTPKVCSASPCNKVNCDSITGNCVSVADNSQTCTDSDPCTTDKCVSGKCVSTPISCNDNNPCTTDQCVAGQCVNHNNFNPCDDKNPCTNSDSCFNGLCEGIPLDCDDKELCTVDYCENGQCKHDPTTGNLVCEDNNYCTPSSFCVAGKCQGFDHVSCDDFNPCTDDICDPVLGQCVFSYNEAECEDGDPCTNNGFCSKGSCYSQPINCLPVDNECLIGECLNGECFYQQNPDVVDCDDSNLCTTDDTCKSGACVGTPKLCFPVDICHDVSCKDGECVQVPNTASCDDGNACTTNDKCSQGVCTGESVVCNDNNPCTDDLCNAAGFCVYNNNAQPCDDGNSCTLGDVCKLGKCSSGSEQVVCDDYNPCTSEYCDSITGECVFSNTDGVCNDLDSCTENDSCVRGRCVGTPVKCSGDNTCYDYFCNSETGTCDQKPNTKICDDNNLCTSFSSCVQGECVGVPVQCQASTECTKYACNPSTGLCASDKLNSGTCSDNNVCTTDDVCVNGDCKGTLQQCNLQCTVASDCVASDLCHTAQCVSNQCVSVAKTCEQTGNPCTENTCDLLTGNCKVSNIAGSCSDNNACTQTDVCRNGVCVGLNARTDCKTTQKCKTSVCNSITGSCDIVSITDSVTTCDDNLLCTVDDVCTPTGCAGTPVKCNDGNICTTDTCDSTTGKCKFEANIEFCNDGNACTKGDYCADSQCVPGKLLECDDKNVCTTDSCVNGVCSFVKLTGTTCSDSNLCSSADECFNGECTGVETLNCDDSNPCTIDSCDPVKGCVHTPSSGNVCNDEDPCTSGDVCTAGTCQGASNCPPADAVIDQCVNYSCDKTKGGCIQTFATGKSCTVNTLCFSPNGKCSSSGVCLSDPIVCDDNNACSADSCDPVTGSCVFVNNNVTCTPTVPNSCFTYACVDKQCTAVTPKNCDDSNPCTIDSCVNGVCQNIVNNGGSCNDGNDCTEKDTCSSEGKCAGTPINCNDNNECTTDTCLDGKCQNSANTNTCTSTDRCALTSVCVNRVCTPTSSKVCDPKSCNNVACDKSSGNCVYTPDNTKTCQDSDKCTIDSCSAGQCVHAPVKCDTPTQQCVESFCNADTGSCGIRSNDALTCTDGNSCTTDKCSSGNCVATPVVCNDDNPCTYAGTCDKNSGTCTSVPYSCHISPCLYYSCVGDGRCKLDGVAPNYNPIIYLSVSTSSTSNQIVALNGTKTSNSLYTIPTGTNKITSMDIDANTGILYGISKASNLVNQLVKISKSSSNTIASPLSTTLLYNNVPANLDVSLRASYVSIVSPYKYDIYALEPNTDKFVIYSESGSLLSNLVTSAPANAALLSWDHYGRTAFYIKKGSKQLYLWQDNISVPICSNVAFGVGTIVSIDTAVDGNIFVGLSNPISVYAITFGDGFICSYSKLTLPTNIGSATLLSLTVDNTYCPLPVGASRSATPSITPSTSPSPVAVIPPPTTGSVAQPGGNLGGASGGSGVSAGQDTNLPLTGTSGYISTAVVGSIAGVAVLFAALFGAVLGLNTSKEDKAIPLATALDSVEVSGIAVNNPTFTPAGNVFSSAL